MCRLAARSAGRLAVLVGLSVLPGYAQGLGSELRRFLDDDASATVHFRSYYLDRTNPTPPKVFAGSIRSFR